MGNTLEGVTQSPLVQLAVLAGSPNGPQNLAALQQLPYLKALRSQEMDKASALNQLTQGLSGKMPSQDLSVGASRPGSVMSGPLAMSTTTMPLLPRALPPELQAPLSDNGQGTTGAPGANLPPIPGKGLTGIQDFIANKMPQLAMQADPASALAAVQARLNPPMIGKLGPNESYYGRPDITTGKAPLLAHAEPAPPEFANGLRAAGILPGDPRYDKAMQAWTDKQTGQDPLTRSEISKNNATTANAGLVESKDAFGNPIIVNKSTGAVTNPTGGIQTIGPEDVQSTAEAIANYKRRPPTGAAARSPFWLSVMGEAQKINPDYNDQIYNSANAARTKFGSGKQGDLVRSANVAVSHLETLNALGNALDNGDTKLVNDLKNKLSDQFGGVPIAGYEAAAPLVGDEVAKFVLGGGSALADREKFASPLSAARGTDSRNAAINSFRGLMVGQLHGLKRQYETETKSKDFADKLDPEVAALLNNPQYAPGNNPSVPPPTPPQGAPQDVKQGNDGGWYSPDPARPGKFLKWQ